MSTTPVLIADKTVWIRDLVFLAFPEGEARERILIDLVQQFSKVDPEDPEWLRYKLSIVECRALENTARSLTEAATEQARLRAVTREITDFAATQMKGSIDSAAQTTRQLLEDVQASLHEAIAGDAILKTYSDETRKHFAAVISSLIDEVLTRALNLAHTRMDDWVKKTLDHSMAQAQEALSAANNDFRNRLTGAWGRMLWACIGGGLIAGTLLLAFGFYLGRNW
jgi:sensor c-di-GMP phosphodiesterase-like protein